MGAQRRDAGETQDDIADASGYRFTGWKATIINFLKRLFGATATTYAEHAGGPYGSVDLWAPYGPGRMYGLNNSRVPEMDRRAGFLAKNLRSLSLADVIWEQRINEGGGGRRWRIVGPSRKTTLTTCIPPLLTVGLAT